MKDCATAADFDVVGMRSQAQHSEGLGDSLSKIEIYHR